MGHGRTPRLARKVDAWRRDKEPLPMCCYCDSRSDAEIVGDISAVAVPEEVLACHHGWAQAVRVWQRYAADSDGEDVSDWIELCQRRARVLARLAVASMPRSVAPPQHAGLR